MPLLIKKSLKDLVDKTLERLNQVGGATSPGSNLRLLIAIINSIQEEFYTTLQEAHLNAFISTASKECLDLIGDLVHCKRLNDELYDDDGDSRYKERISQNVTALESCNQLAIRMAVLSVQNVSDIQIKKWTHGTGSFSVFVIPDNFSDVDAIVANVASKLEQTEAYGIRHNVEAPDLLEVSFKIRIIYTHNVLNEEKDIIASKAQRAVADYINSRSIGESLIYNEIIAAVMSVSEYIYDMDIYHYTINGDTVMHTNQECEWFEKFIEASNADAIIVS